METIKLKVSKRFYNQFMAIIGKCDPKDLQIVNDHYDEAKSYLDKQLKELESESAEFMTLEELDDALEKVISQYEN